MSQKKGWYHHRKTGLAMSQKERAGITTEEQGWQCHRKKGWHYHRRTGLAMSQKKRLASPQKNRAGGVTGKRAGITTESRTGNVTEKRASITTEKTGLAMSHAWQCVLNSNMAECPPYLWLQLFLLAVELR
jgi:hypothetical protein